MSQPKSAVILQTNDEAQVLELRDLGVSDCVLQVSSGRFSYQGRFYFDRFDNFISELELLALTLVGTATLREDYNDSYLRLEGATRGRITVSGLLVEHSELGQELRFAFSTDQTCLAPFVRDLEAARSS